MNISGINYSVVQSELHVDYMARLKLYDIKTFNATYRQGLLPTHVFTLCLRQRHLHYKTVWN